MKTLLILIGMLACVPAHAKLKVVTTLPDLRVLATEIGGERVDVESIARGTQDPHQLEAKPSFMVSVSRADLVIAIGLELEDAWFRPILRGARNPQVNPGGKGFLEVGPLVERIEIPGGKVSRADGDVHPEGNPHVTLDPLRMAEIGEKVAERLAALDPEGSSKYQTAAKSFRARMAAKVPLWKERIRASGVKEAVTYHRLLSYFFDRFGIGNPIHIEPKPGIPPSGAHLLEVAKLVRERKIPVILNENLYDDAGARKIASSTGVSVRVEVVPVSTDGAPGVKTLDDLYETIVLAIEGKAHAR